MSKASRRAAKRERRAAERAQNAVVSAAVESAIESIEEEPLFEDEGPQPAPEPEPAPKIAMRSLPLDLLAAVLKLVKKHGESEIVVKYESDILVIATGEAAEAMRTRNPIAAIVSTRAVAEPVAARMPTPRTVAPRGNAHRFISSSELDLDAPDEDEIEQEPSNVVQMQENGMPVAPRDRTRAQRSALVVTDDNGRPALAVEPERLSSMKEAAILKR